MFICVLVSSIYIRYLEIQFSAFSDKRFIINPRDFEMEFLFSGYNKKSRNNMHDSS